MLYKITFLLLPSAAFQSVEAFGEGKRSMNVLTLNNALVSDNVVFIPITPSFAVDG